MAKHEKKPKSKIRKILEWVFTGVFLILIGGCCFILIFSKVNQDKTNPNAPIKIGNVYLPLIVKTNSMEPDYKVNCAVFIKYIDPEELIKDFEEGKNVDLTFDDSFLVPSSLLFDQSDYQVLKDHSKTFRTTTPENRLTITHRMFHYKVNTEATGDDPKYLFFVEGINRNSDVLGAENQYQVFTEQQLFGRVIGSSVFVGAIFNFVTTPIGLIVLLLIPCLYLIISSVIDLFKKSDEEEHKIAIEGATTPNISNNDPLSNISEKDRKRLKEELMEQLIQVVI